MPPDRDADGRDSAFLPIGESFDLHSFAPADIPDVVVEYLTAARDAGLREVRLIHGRGSGVQRARVHAVLRTLPWVLEVREATPDLGGWGATIAVLAPAEPVPTR